MHVKYLVIHVEYLLLECILFSTIRLSKVFISIETPILPLSEFSYFKHNRLVHESRGCLSSVRQRCSICPPVCYLWRILEVSLVARNTVDLIG